MQLLFVIQIQHFSPIYHNHKWVHICTAQMGIITQEPFLVNGVWNRAMPPGIHSLLKAVAKWQGRQTCSRFKVGDDAYILQGCCINTTAFNLLFVFPWRALGTEKNYIIASCALFYISSNCRYNIYSLCKKEKEKEWAWMCCWRQSSSISVKSCVGTIIPYHNATLYTVCIHTKSIHLSLYD